ncbi:hypothetical protein COO60DRAFT_602617 [Scenedesmus sp. NREL 46B-D3]|nr:hypothetical protein COO60DRAFT_602617 [Scenedesmus sp. NREL 46B-D3]
MPPGSWAAVRSSTVHAAAAGPEGHPAVSPAPPAGKQKKQQKPLVRAFPTFGDMGTVKNLAKFYFIDPLPESLTALDGVGPTNDDGEAWTPARADAANLERWRGGRQGLFQRWYEIRFVAAQVTEMVKQLSAKAGPGVLPTVTEAAAVLDGERSEMKLTLNKYYQFLKGSRSKNSGSNEVVDGTDVAGSGDGEAGD